MTADGLLNDVGNVGESYPLVHKSPGGHFIGAVEGDQGAVADSNASYAMRNDGNRSKSGR